MNVIPPITITDAGTFTRASTGTFFDENGVMQIAGVDVPRFSYDPADLTAAPVFLDEDAATNLLTYSGQLENAAYTKTRSSVSANVTVAPDGTLTADKLIEDATASNTHYAEQTASVASGVTYTYAVYVKAGERTRLNVSFFAGTTIAATFDVSNGSVVSGASGSISVVENGWYRCAVTGIATITGTGFFSTYLNNGSGTSYTGDGTSGLYIWGEQLEAGSVATSYIPTTSAPVTRAADVNTEMMVSSVPEVAPTAYNAGATYADGDEVSTGTVGGVITVWRSLQASNLGNTPASSPTWWENIGTTYGSYSGAATYALDDTVIDPTNHLVYQSLAAGNVGNALSDTTKWQEKGPTNRWLMFDFLRNTATVQPGSITVVITPGQRVDSIGLAGLVANSVTITETVDGIEVYSHTEDLNTRFVSDAYEYCFRPFSTRKATAVFDIPPYTNGVITITATATSGNAEIGACMLGLYEYIGDVEYEAESDVLNFSTVTRLFDGTTDTRSMVQRPNVPKTVQRVVLDKALVNKVRTVRDSLNGIPAFWAGLDDGGDGYFEALLIVGFYKRFSINLKHPEHAIISLELEEI